MIRKHLTVAAIALSAGVALTAGLAAPAAAATSATCQRLQDMIEDDRAQEALDLITALQAPILETHEVRSPEDAASLASLLDEACEAQRLHAVVVLSAADEDDEVSWATTAGKQWDGFVKTWITPLLGSLAAFSGIVVALLIAARLFTYIPGIRDGVPSKRGRRLLLASGLLLIGAAAWAIVARTWQINSAAKLPDGAIATIVMLIILGVLGAIFCALYLASRLRLDIAVTDLEEKQSAWDTATLIEGMKDFGASRPADVDVPTGTDITALAGNALPDVGGGTKAWGVIQGVFTYLFLGSPWRVRVATDGLAQAAVSIQRNGAPATRVAIDASEFKLPIDLPPKEALRIFSTAVILITLSRRHDGFEGLLGATKWDSVGLQYIATRKKTDELSDEDRGLLQVALDIDRHNLLAKILKQNADLRAGEPEVRDDYRAWLDQTIEVLVGKRGHGRPLELEMRLRRILALIDTGRVELPALETRTAETEDAPADEGQEQAQDKARQDAQAKAEEAAKTKARDNVRELMKELHGGHSVPDEVSRDRLRGDAAIAYAELINSNPNPKSRYNIEQDAAEWLSAVLDSPWPQDAYAAACHYAATRRLPLALVSLHVACRDPRVRPSVRTEPLFEPLRTSADTKTKGEFNKLAFDDVEADIERLEPVQQVLRELGPVGIYTLDDLVAVDAKKLSEYLDGGAWAMSELEVARLQRIAKFEILVRDLVPPATVAPVRVELLKLLLDDNIETPASIPDIWTTGADPAVAEFAKKIKDAFDKVVKPGEITAWLKALKDWKPPTAPTLTPSSP